MNTKALLKLIGFPVALFCLPSCVVKTERSESLVSVPERPNPYALPFPPKMAGIPFGKWKEQSDEPVEDRIYNPYRKNVSPVKKSHTTVSFSTIFHECWGKKVNEGYRIE